MPRAIKQSDDARQATKRGIDRAADIVKATLGVNGRNVILDTNPYTQPTNTNDGVTILRELEFEDPFENVGLKAIKEAAARTNDVAGDGTTTASVLMQAIVNEGHKAIIAGADPIAIRRGIERGAKDIVNLIKENVTKAKDLQSLISTAIISCGGDTEIGKMVAEIIFESGVEGVVTLEDSPEVETTTEQIAGLKLRGSFNIPNYINVPELQQSVLTDTPVFVTNASVVSGPEMAKIMEVAFSTGKKQVVIIANSIEGDALMTSLKNWVNKKFFALPIRVLAYGDMGEGMLRDVAAITGAKFYDSMTTDNINDLLPEHLGTIQKIVAEKHETTIIANDNAKKEARIKELQAQVKATNRQFEQESLKERIAKLNNALFTIKVGGQTDTERQERKLRIEDAINATKAALIDGVVSGGGSTLYRSSVKITTDLTGDELIGFKAVLKACQEPIEQMARNGSIRLDRSDLKAIEKNNMAIDFRTGEVVKAFEYGIIDPVKVVISGLENAASGAALFLTTEAVVVRQEAPKEEQV
jgi:chaperonin GroEL